MIRTPIHRRQSRTDASIDVSNDRAQFESIDAWLADLAAEDLFSGTALIARDGEIWFERAYGLASREWNIPNTTDTKFRLASVSKQFCSMLVMQLVQEGVIGDLKLIRTHFTFERPANAADVRYQPDLAGGAFGYRAIEVRGAACG